MGDVNGKEGKEDIDCTHQALFTGLSPKSLGSIRLLLSLRLQEGDSIDCDFK